LTCKAGAVTGVEAAINGRIAPIRSDNLTIDDQASGRDNVPTQDFTDEQRKAMLKGIHEREGKWNNVNIESELNEIGSTAELSLSSSAQLFKQLIDEHYIDTGRIFHAGGRVDSNSNGEAVDYGGILIPISYDMRLTDKGRAFIGV